MTHDLEGSVEHALTEVLGELKPSRGGKGTDQPKGQTNLKVLVSFALCKISCEVKHLQTGQVEPVAHVVTENGHSVIGHDKNRNVLNVILESRAMEVNEHRSVGALFKDHVVDVEVSMTEHVEGDLRSGLDLFEAREQKTELTLLFQGVAVHVANGVFALLELF